MESSRQKFFRQRYNRPHYETDFIKIPPVDSQRNIETREHNEKENQVRKAIFYRIIELKEKGLTEEEAIEELKKDFPNSQFEGYFKTWVENGYKKDKSKSKPFMPGNVRSRNYDREDSTR